MTIDLTKGQKVDLTKGKNIGNVKIGLGWDAQAEPGKPAFDLDAMAFLTSKGKCLAEKDFVYFKNLNHPSGAIIHSGDNLTGAGPGDDEVISVDLAKIPAQYDELYFAVCIFKAAERKQNFGQVSNAFIRVFDDREEHLKYKLDDGYSAAVSVKVAKIYRDGTEWKFAALGQGFAGEIGPLAKEFGLPV